MNVKAYHNFLFYNVIITRNYEKLSYFSFLRDYQQFAQKEVYQYGRFNKSFL